MSENIKIMDILIISLILNKSLTKAIISVSGRHVDLKLLVLVKFVR